MDTKICQDCKQEKELGEFYRRYKTKSSYYARCRQCHYLWTQKWRKNNPDKRKIYTYNWNHKPETKQKIKIWRQNNVPYKIRKNCRTRIQHSLKLYGVIKSKRTEEMVGCPLKQLKEHLEHNFQDGMTWDNYGREGWHIDHKIPCAAFNLSNPSEQKKCFHYTNLTPKWANENRKKSDKLADGTLARHLPLLPFNTPASN